MTARDLLACSLAPSDRRRAAVLRALLTADQDGRPTPAPRSLETCLLTLGCDPPDVGGMAARLRNEADALTERGRSAGLVLVGWADAPYPRLLRLIDDPPPVLWIRGDVARLDAPSVAIIGSRAASPYGLCVARQLGHDLAASGVTVVSGLARGCDGAAHEGALQAGGASIGVVGCGADVVYPREHASLYARLADSGAVVSELPPGAAPLPAHFPQRNRIISGLAAGVVVIEASTRSGSLITAACALEQGREVMAVPGNVLSERHIGSHELLRDGACLVQSARDVLEVLGWASGAADRRTGTEGTAEEKAGDPLGILACVPPGEDADVEALALRLGREPAVLLAELTRLELAGALERTSGGRFVRPGR